MEKEKAVAAAIAATIATAGVATDAAFDNPGDILRNDNPQPVVQHLDGTSSDDDSSQQDDEKGKKAGITKRETVRETIQKLPLAVRIVFVLPLWAIGNLINLGGSMLFAFVSPALGWIGSFFLMVLGLAFAFTLTAKLIFPDLPLKKILNKKSFAFVFVLSILATGADGALYFMWPEYAAYKYLIKAAATILPLGILTVWFVIKEKRRRAREFAEVTQGDPAKELVYTSLGQTFTIRDTE